MSRRVPAVPEWYWWMVLSRIPGIGRARFEALIKEFSSPEEAFWAPEERLCRIEGIGKELASRIIRAREDLDVAGDIRLLRRLGARVVHREDPSYPPALRRISDSPPVLYVRGEVVPADDKAVAVVGTRNPSAYGMEAAYRLSAELASSGFTVVSGLAVGCDSAAHRGALSAGGRTLAVLGSGIDIIYPPENSQLAWRITRSGAVISEFAPGYGPAPGQFAARNRIISGLSLGVVVVEAGRKSGALITASCALEQGREVMCVPGSIFNPKAEGCHDLIRSGAVLVRDFRDVLDEIRGGTAAGRSRGPEESPSAVGGGEHAQAGYGAASGDVMPKHGGATRGSASPSRRPARRIARPRSLPGAKGMIYNAVGFEPVLTDEIIARTGLEAREVLVNLVSLEMDGLLVKLPGGKYRRKG